MGGGRDEEKESFSWDAWKWRVVGTEKVCSSRPWVMVSGLKEEDDRGVVVPVCVPFCEWPAMLDRRDEEMSDRDYESKYLVSSPNTND